jgi:hypothetical protein
MLTKEIVQFRQFSSIFVRVDKATGLIPPEIQLNQQLSKDTLIIPKGVLFPCHHEDELQEEQAAAPAVAPPAALAVAGPSVRPRSAAALSVAPWAPC